MFPEFFQASALGLRPPTLPKEAWVAADVEPDISKWETEIRALKQAINRILPRTARSSLPAVPTPATEKCSRRISPTEQHRMTTWLNHYEFKRHTSVRV